MMKIILAAIILLKTSTGWSIEDVPCQPFDEFCESKKTFGELLENDNVMNNSEEILKKVLKSNDPRKGLARHLILRKYVEENRYNEALLLCNSFPPKDNELLSQSQCITSNFMSKRNLELFSQDISLLILRANQLNASTEILIRIYRGISTTFQESNFFFHSAKFAKDAIDLIQKDQSQGSWLEAADRSLKAKLATLYTNSIFGNKIHQEALDLYLTLRKIRGELLKGNISPADSAIERHRLEVETFNIGVLNLYHLKNYALASSEFSQLISNKLYGGDATIYLSIALALEGSFEQSKKILNDFTGRPIDPAVTDSMPCYIEIAKVLNKLKKFELRYCRAAMKKYFDDVNFLLENSDSLAIPPQDLLEIESWVSKHFRSTIKEDISIAYVKKTEEISTSLENAQIKIAFLKKEADQETLKFRIFSGISVILCLISGALVIALRSSSRANKQNRHAFVQMKKMIYPHQLQQIRSGRSLEETMPVTQKIGCVVAFDIVGSSKIKHVLVKEFLRSVFQRCYEEMAKGYEQHPPKARAFRIKEMGDGFLCSIGFPFEPLNKNIANEALDLAEIFSTILDEEARFLEMDNPPKCGIGIAIGPISGFYPDSGTKEYDLHGEGIIQATRYEAMRKTIFPDGQDASVIIIQEKVYESLSRVRRKEFSEIDLRQNGITVRDDPGAVKLYYKYLTSLGDKDSQPTQQQTA
jgi:class 3 adenylate cyclase